MNGNVDFEADIEYARSFPIGRLLEEYGFQMKKTGANSVMLCPFHDEKTASFTVFSGGSRAQCFGCNWFGDSIDFVKAYEGLDFKGAVKFIKGK
jgi:DNA primase